MLYPRLRAKLRMLSLVVSIMASGSLFITGCTITDIKNSAVKGVTDAIQAGTRTWVSSLLPDLAGELLGPFKFPDNSVDLGE